MRPTLYIPVGIPGSGKSTWAAKVDAQVISSDAIRESLFGGRIAAHDPEKKAANNDRVFATFHRLIAMGLGEGRGVIADATNLTARSRRTLRNIAEEQGARTVLVLFNNVGQAVKWNQERDEDAIVPDDVMEHMIAKWLVAREMALNEGYSSTTVINEVGR